MADFIFNVSKGAIAEKLRDDPTKLGILLLKTAESDAAMKDRTTVADVLAGSTEADFTNYARKTSITGTVTVDQTNDLVAADISDPLWASAGGGVNNSLVKLIIFYEESAADSGRIPLAAYDYVATTNGSDLGATVNAGGFYQAS